jgi:hypothetical protein
MNSLHVPLTQPAGFEVDVWYDLRKAMPSRGETVLGIEVKDVV